MAKFNKGDKIRRKNSAGSYGENKEIFPGGIYTVINDHPLQVEEYINPGNDHLEPTYFDLVHPSELAPAEVLIFN